MRRRYGVRFSPSTDAFANCPQKESVARRYGLLHRLRIGAGAIGARAGGYIGLSGGSDPAASLTSISSAATSSTAASAIRGSIPRRTNALDQLVWPGGR